MQLKLMQNKIKTFNFKSMTRKLVAHDTNHAKIGASLWCFQQQRGCAKLKSRQISEASAKMKDETFTIRVIYCYILHYKHDPKVFFVTVFSWVFLPLKM